MELYDNFLSKEDFFLLRQTYCNLEFPWYWGPILHPMGSGYPDLPDKVQIQHNWQACHTLYDEKEGKSDSYNISPLNPLLEDERLNVSKLHRIKINLNPPTSLDREDRIKYFMHTDFCKEVHGFECTTGILYLNTCNGYTQFEDGTKVDCVENRYVTFPSNTRHSGVSTTEQGMKVVINFNYTEGHGSED